MDSTFDDLTNGWQDENRTIILLLDLSLRLRLFQLLRKQDCSIDRLIKLLVSIGEITSEASFKSRALILSRSIALFALRPRSCSRTKGGFACCRIYCRGRKKYVGANTSY